MPEAKGGDVEVGTSRPVVVVSYGLSKQIALGSKDSPWHNASVTFSIPLDEGANAQDAADEWMATAKTFVMAELEVPAKLSDEGGLQPDLDIPKSSSKGGSRRSSSPKSGSVSSDLPTVEIDGVTYVDYREAKAAGDKPERFPDFKTPDNKRSEWILDREGNVKEEFAAYA